MTKNNRSIDIIAQAFYGNRTHTTIRLENVDMFIWGVLDSKFEDSLPKTYKEGRTVVNVPDTDNIVIVYNKDQEKQDREDVKRYEKEGYVGKPLAVIPEIGVTIYSRCFVCRMNEAGELESLLSEDYPKFMKYLA